VTRSRASAKAAGTRFETLIANYLAEQLDDRIERRARTGSKDRGDIAGLRGACAGRIVAECKDYGGRIKAGEWLGEAEIERGNDDAVAGIVIAKRRGTTDPGEQFVLMTVADFVAISSGRRPPEA